MPYLYYVHYRLMFSILFYSILFFKTLVTNHQTDFINQGWVSFSFWKNYGAVNVTDVIMCDVRNKVCVGGRNQNHTDSTL